MTEDRTQADIDGVRRDRFVWTTMIILGVIVAAGILALSWRLIEPRLTAAKQLDRAIALLKESDTTIVAVDAAVRAEVSPQSATKAAELAPLVEVAGSQLAEAEKLAVNGIDRLTDDEQKKARLVQSASTSRAAMLAKVPAIFSAKRQAATAQVLADEAWTKTVAADKLAVQSVAGYNKLKRADVKAAASANANADAGFATARDLFDRAALLFPEAKLSAFSVYVDGRLKLVVLSKKAGDAWLGGKVVEANKLRVEYNKADALSVQRAKQLPGTPAAAIANAYNTLVEAPVAEYFKAREKAVEADNALKSL